MRQRLRLASTAAGTRSSVSSYTCWRSRRRSAAARSAWSRGRTPARTRTVREQTPPTTALVFGDASDRLYVFLDQYWTDIHRKYKRYEDDDLERAEKQWSEEYARGGLAMSKVKRSYSVGVLTGSVTPRVNKHPHCNLSRGVSERLLVVAGSGAPWSGWSRSTRSLVTARPTRSCR